MSLQIYEREAWGAAAPANAQTLLSKSQIDELVAHYSSMEAERRLDHSGCAAVVRSIQQYHQKTKGWNDIAYSYLVCNHGGVFEGRGWGVMTAATFGHNDHTQAVCFLGGDVVNRDDVRVDGRLALSHVVREFHSKFGATKRVVGHRDRVKTDCPGDEIYSWVLAQGWKASNPTIQPWPIPIPKWFWLWAKWRRSRFAYPSYKAWMAARPKSAPKSIPAGHWAWVRLAAMSPKVV